MDLLAIVLSDRLAGDGLLGAVAALFELFANLGPLLFSLMLSRDENGFILISVCYSPDKGTALPASVYAHEMIGRELQLMLALGDDVVRYRSREAKQAKVGESVHLWLSLDGACVLDRASGKALTPARARMEE